MVTLSFVIPFKHLKVTKIIDAMLFFDRLLSSQVFSVGSKIGCNNIAGLVKSQRAICSRYPRLMLKVGEGAAKALTECQRQFRFGRWNCSVTDGTSPILGKLMSKGNAILIHCFVRFYSLFIVLFSRTLRHFASVNGNSRAGPCRRNSCNHLRSPNNRFSLCCCCRCTVSIWCQSVNLQPCTTNGNVFSQFVANQKITAKTKALRHSGLSASVTLDNLGEIVCLKLRFNGA